MAACWGSNPNWTDAMSSSISFPEQKLDLRDVANECARRVLQLEAGPVREIARGAARKSPIKLDWDSVGVPTGDAVDAMKLHARVLEARREELGEDRFRDEQRDVMNAIDDALNHAACEIAAEAIEGRVRELSEQEGLPLPGGQSSCCC